MTDLDREIHAAIVELSRRLRDEPLTVDPDRFAQEYLAWLRGHGWRPTPAKAQPDAHAPGAGLPKNPEVAELVREARGVLADLAELRHEEAS